MGGGIMSREQLKLVYLDYFNNFLTIETYAEHYGLTYEEAYSLLAVAKSCATNPHPDA